MTYFNLVLLPILFCSVIGGCNLGDKGKASDNSVRQLVDTVGFAQYPWQMDSLMARIGRTGWKKTEADPWKLAICPHDDYTYVGSLYPELLQNIEASTLILIGVAHKAARMGIEDSLVFDNYSCWKGPWKNIPVSPVREELLKQLSGRFAIVSDTLHKVEHSVEAMIPFLQYFNHDISIVPILVPAMNPDRMENCGKALATAVRRVAKKHGWEWGKDYAIIVTTDAIHYGNEDWGGSDYAFFGCDTIGNLTALDYEAEIIRKCLTGKITQENFRLFNLYTLKIDNYKEYLWTWCGRYCVPVALYASYFLNDSQPLSGDLVGYSTSITSGHIPVDDIGMGRTAIATDCHWVGYAAIGYR
jgi:AmmeMemoRadiSam system protein B